MQSHMRQWGGVLACLLLAACAGSGERISDGAMASLQQSLQGKRVSALIDGCVIRDTVGEDFILVRKSELLAEALMLRLYAIAEREGMSLRRVEQSLLCSRLDQQERAGYTIAEAEPGQAQATGLYSRRRSTGLDQDSLDLIQFFIHKTRVAAGFEDGRQAAQVPGALGMRDEQLREIGRILDADQVLLLEGTGYSVSGAKQISQGLLTAVASLLVSGGAVATSSAPLDGLTHSAALVDLASGQVSWARSGKPSPANPLDVADLSGAWSRDILAPLFAGDLRETVDLGQAADADTAPRQPVTPQVATGQPLPAPRPDRPSASPGPVFAAAAPPPPEKVAMPVPRFQKGASIRLGSALSLRSRPAGTEPVSAAVPAGATVSIVSRRLEQGQYWWYVSADAAQGWVADSAVQQAGP